MPPKSGYENHSNKEKLASLIVLDVAPYEAAEQLGVNVRTYWRWRGRWEAEMGAQFLQNQWRIITEWWVKQKRAHRDLIRAYAKSVKAAEEDPQKHKPNYFLLLESTKLEDGIFDRMQKIGLLPNAMNAGISQQEDLKELFLQAWRNVNERNKNKAKAVAATS